MRTHSRVLGFVALVALSVLVAACPGDPPPNIPTAPSQQTVTAVEVVGPDTIAPGQSAQYTVTVNLSSFVSKLPRSVKWLSSIPSFIQINQLSGVATGGQAYGNAGLIADVTLPDGKVVRAFKVVLNIPEGTFALSGQITDAEIPQLPVVGARVLVEAGKVEGNTDANGFYRLYGVPPTAEFQITAAGYHPLTQTVELFTHGRKDFQLALAGPRPATLDGFYTLTIDGGSACDGALPADLRIRNYDATVTQTGQTVNVRLTEPRFAVVGGSGDRFVGQMNAAGTSVLFALSEFYNLGQYPSIAERLPNGTYLVTEGAVSTTRSGASLTGTVGGWITNYVASFPASVADHGYCSGPRFTLTPR